MAIDSFIPAIWSRALLVRLHNSLVYGQPNVVNTDYEGEIAGQGSSVKIHGIGPVTVSTYTKNVDLSAPEALTDTEEVLTIDQARSFNFQVDDVDKIQQILKVMEGAMAEAAYALANDADSWLAGQIAAQGTADGGLFGTTGTPIVPDTTTAYEMLVDAGTALTAAKCPMDGRYIVVPPWFHGMMQKDSRFILYSESAHQTLLNGEIGEASGFTILQSNNVPNTDGTKYQVIFGHNMAVTMAAQINSVEAYRPPLRFADAVKGLHLFGAKVVRPTIMGTMILNAA